MSTWRDDLDLLLRMTDRDEKLLARAKKKLSDDERRIIDAVVETKGDLEALKQRLGPLLIAKLTARCIGPRAKPGSGAEVWKIVEAPLRVAWTPPSSADPFALAEAFTARYATKLEELTGRCDTAAKAAASLSQGLKTLKSSRELLELAGKLQAQVQELRSVAQDCAHPSPDKAKWASDAADLAREAHETLSLVERLMKGIGTLDAALSSVATSLRDWIDAPVDERAERAESMGARVRAAHEVALAMHEDFLTLVFANS